MEHPLFTVIIPVVHGRDDLRRTLASAVGLDPAAGNFEILVAGRADDREAEAIVRAIASSGSVPPVYLGVESDRRSVLLNAACGKAEGAILAFTDDDSLPHPDWLIRLRGALDQEPRPALVGGEDDLATGAGTFDRALNEVLRSPLLTGRRRTKRHPRLFNMALSRDLAGRMARVPGSGLGQVFDERLSHHEDLDLVRRVERGGGRVIVDPEIRIDHARRTNFSDNMRWNAGLARACRFLGERRSVHLGLTLFYGAVGVCGAAALLERVFLLPLIGLLAIYFIPIFGGGIAAAVRTGSLRVGALFPAVLLSMHASRVWGYLVSRP
jgi:glycosyltransferase involved in cell wall biosynthesis